MVVAVIAMFLLRIYFLKLPGYSLDIATFIAWADGVRELGIVGLYNPANQVAIDYPPLIPLLSCWWLALMRSLDLGGAYAFKILPTIAELILTALVIFFIWGKEFKYKLVVIALIIIQPALALITSAWGQVDAIMTLLIVAGFLLSPKNQTVGTIFLALAFLMKTQAIIAIFIYLVWILLQKGIKQFALQLIVGAGLVGLVGFIFAQSGGNFLPIFWNSASHYPYLSMNAFNFWWMLYGPEAFSLSDGTGVTSSKFQGLIMFITFLAPALYYLKAQAKRLPELFLITSYSYLIFFVFLTQMHERYLYPAVALLPFAILSSKKVPAIYIILTVTLFINCFAVMQTVFPQFHFLFLDSFALMGQWTKIIGAVNVLTAIYLALYLSLASLGGKTNE